MFECAECGKTYSKWQGKCDSCGEWNTIIQSSKQGSAQKTSPHSPQLQATTLSAIQKTSGVLPKFPTKISEFDDLLSGGLAPGQVVLLSGEPGIGKSTLAIQAAGAFGRHATYISGEETTEQVAERARRVNTPTTDFELAYSTDTASIAEHVANSNKKITVIDSIQTVAHPDYPGNPGSVSQVKASTYEIIRSAKESGNSVIIVGQVTKSGAIAGPKTLEHMVDTVLQIEGDKNGELRIGRCTKNRFGKAGLSAVFKMTEKGLVGVKDPASAFLSHEKQPQIGVAKSITIDGQLPIGIEIQALTSNTAFSLPNRVARGIDKNKLFLILGVIEKHTKIGFGQSDVYVNVAGGLTTKEPGVDLGIAAAILSSQKNIGVPQDAFFIGEIELSGRIRPASAQEKRVDIAKKCGATDIYAPNDNRGSGTRQSISSIYDLYRAISKAR